MTYLLKKSGSNDTKPTILAVDDEIHSLKLFERSFRKDFEVITENDPFKAIELLEREGDKIAAILCDQRMPKISGIDLLIKAKEASPNTIRIMITSYLDTQTLMECINACQVYCYVLKPFDPSNLKLTLHQAITHREHAIRNLNIIKDIQQLLYGTICAICEALEEKDTYTIGHSRRVTSYTLAIGKELNFNPVEMQKLKLAGLLHDIGKIGISDQILNKPGRLSEHEFAQIKKHPESGYNIIKNIKQLGEVSNWVKYHHERYDGRGYPSRLSGEMIPVGASILAVADTYDAMTSDRAYRKGLPHEVAVAEIKKCSGSQFNPHIAEAFLRSEHLFKEMLKDKERLNKTALQQLIG